MTTTMIEVVHFENDIPSVSISMCSNYYTVAWGTKEFTFAKTGDGLVRAVKQFETLCFMATLKF
ncbi:hypothetical protein vBPpSSYP_15 [Pseudomonas phage vB_PpS_SYP]|nr:hypothetical protein vBPpSSYP_15 [Pseudomonas phage vB_PpS_SYP]